MYRRDTHVGTFDLPDLAGLEPVVGDERGVTPVVGLHLPYHPLLQRLRVSLQILILKARTNLKTNR